MNLQKVSLVLEQHVFACFCHFSRNLSHLAIFGEKVIGGANLLILVNLVFFSCFFIIFKKCSILSKSGCRAKKLDICSQVNTGFVFLREKSRLVLKEPHLATF